MKLAVIVLCFNDEEIAFKYVKTIYGYNSIDKIIVVDNGSEKEIYDKLENKIQSNYSEPPLFKDEIRVT